MKTIIASGLVAAIVAIAGSIDAGRTSAEQLGGWGNKICWDEDGSARPCPPPPPPPPPDAGPDESSDSLMKKVRDPHDDSFCNLCHVNRTGEAAGPMWRSSVLADPPTFWRRHRDIAARIQDKRVLTSLRDTRTLSSTLQRLMAARPAR